MFRPTIYHIAGYSSNSLGHVNETKLKDELLPCIGGGGKVINNCADVRLSNIFKLKPNMYVYISN